MDFVSCVKYSRANSNKYSELIQKKTVNVVTASATINLSYSLQHYKPQTKFITRAKKRKERIAETICL